MDEFVAYMKKKQELHNLFRIEDRFFAMFKCLANESTTAIGHKAQRNKKSELIINKDKISELNL